MYRVPVTVFVFEVVEALPTTKKPVQELGEPPTGMDGMLFASFMTNTCTLTRYFRKSPRPLPGTDPGTESGSHGSNYGDRTDVYCIGSKISYQGRFFASRIRSFSITMFTILRCNAHFHVHDAL